MNEEVFPSCKAAVPTVQQLAEQLIHELGGFGVPCTHEQACLLSRHLLLVIEKNKAMNLTRITDSMEAVTLHVVDSLLPLALPAVQLKPSSRFVDIGTGAGFPGIPLAVVSGAHGTLIDSVGKKVAAAQGFIDELALSNAEAVHMRAECLPRGLLGTQDAVFARAVAQANTLIEYAAPMLRHEGTLVLEKGKPGDEELATAAVAAEICGLKGVSRETFELPRGLGHRTILVYKKVGEPKIKLPRRVGLAKSSPLGTKR